MTEQPTSPNHQLTPPRDPADRTEGPPLILVTNDDGIRSRGLNVLVETLSEVAEVVAVAPDGERSAVGHGLSLELPLRIFREGPGRYGVSGTPADAVLLGLHQVCRRRPSLVVSGINYGLNLGTDVFYSGTVAGALEGTIRGVQAVAISQELPPAAAGDKGVPNTPEAVEALFRRTAEFCAGLCRYLLDHPLEPDTALNVNAPATDTRSYAWTVQGMRVYRERVEERLDPRRRPYYWIGGPPVNGLNAPGTDGFAVEAGLISVTRLGLNLSQPPADWYDQVEFDGFRRGEA